MDEKTQRFIEKARKIYGDKYDYSKVVYKTNRTKVCIICPEHGEFWQTPSNHLHGYEGCSECANNNIRQRLLKNKDIFVEQARKVHGNKYDYSKVKYIDNNTKVCIICPEHGEFWQTPHSHLNNRGCPKCSGREIVTLTTFLERARKKYGEKFSYAEDTFKGYEEKMKIICPEHGEFWQTPRNHIKCNCGCPACGKKHAEQSMLKVQNNFISRARAIHGDKYDYSKTIFRTARDNALITCPLHGDFSQIIADHLMGHGCPSCGTLISKGEDEIFSFLEGLSVKCEKRNRTILNRKEIDIYIPDYKIGIEFDGIRWHSEEFGKGKEYHLNKTEECKKQGIRLIHIFEDEWLYKQEIIKHKILHILHKDTHCMKIGARKCSVREITYKESNLFLEQYHLQGSVRGSVYLGSFYKDILVGAMIFKKEDKNKKEWELSRFATNWDYSLPGIASKMFNFFIKKYTPSKVKSFLDRCWNNESSINVYDKLGFHVESVLPPDYKYVKGMERIHKFNCRKKILAKKYNFPLSMTEKEMTLALKMYRIWDCGLVKYVWKND